MARQAFVLMTAMPPTHGHMALIEFAREVVGPEMGTVEVHLQTQPGEPFVWERYEALNQATQNMRNVTIHHMHKALPQEPDAETEAQFWDMWAGFLKEWGIRPGDFIVASEAYGMKLAEKTDSIFIPFDLPRTIVSAKATWVREDPVEHFEDMIPEFQAMIRKRVTIFGAESTGKTTLSRILAEDLPGVWLPEWARPYMEACAPRVTLEVMRNIWIGQRALQVKADTFPDARVSPFIIQDTDLFSTVGYWELSDSKMWAGEAGNVAPRNLVEDAIRWQSDLYIITRSNIPFEADPLRFGGDQRESSDQYWIDLCEKYGLNYVVLEESDLNARADAAYDLCMDLYLEDAGKLAYTREGAEYRKGA